MFVPSEYSGVSSFVALDNASCEKYKKLRKKYLKKMWATPIFTKERQAFEHKANAAHANYLACKEAGGTKSLEKLSGKSKHKQGKGLSKKSAASMPQPSAEADAAAAAAAAEEAGGGNLPVAAFGLVALLVVGGGAFFLLKQGKKKKKKKHGLPGLPGTPSAAEKHLPRELAPSNA